MKVGRDLKAVVEVGHWSLVVVTLVMALVGWLGLVLVSEPSPEGHGAAFCASTGFHWLMDLWSSAGGVGLVRLVFELGFVKFPV